MKHTRTGIFLLKAALLLGAAVAFVPSLNAQSAADRLSASRGGNNEANARADSTLAAAGDPASRYILGGVIETEGSFLRQVEKRDSILIGDQIWYGVLLKDVADGTLFGAPELKGSLMDKVDVLTPWIVDTVTVTKIKKTKLRTFDIEIRTLITSFDEGDYELPQIPIQRMLPHGQVDTLVFNSQVLSVKTLPIDMDTFEPHDIKPQMKYPVTFRELLPWILGLLGAAALAWLVVVLISRRRKKAAEQNALEPAHIVALRKLEKYRGSKFWAPDKQKTFYSGVTDTLREYMARRYEFGAMEMTTAEIFDALKETDAPAEMMPPLKELFETSDFVKFARHTVDENAAAGVLPLAVKFVTETYIPETQEVADNANLDRPAMEYDEDMGDYIKRDN